MSSRTRPTHRGRYRIHPRGPEDLLRTHPAVVPTQGSIETGAERADVCREAVALSTVPDLVRLCDAFPPPGSGKVTPREHAQVVGLELSTNT